MLVAGRRGRTEGRDAVAPTERSRSRSWKFATWSLLAAGFVCSICAGVAWTNHQRAAAAKQFTFRASSMAGAISESLQRGLDFQRSFGQLVTSISSPTNRELSKWLESMDIAKTYPGTMGMTLIERVPANQLGAYEDAIESDPIPGYGPGPYPVYPPGIRSSYCLARYGIILKPTSEPPGVDLCSPEFTGMASPLVRVMNRATDTGQPQFFGYSSLMSAFRGKVPASMVREYRNQYLVFLPVFGAAADSSSSTRQTRPLVGWVLSNFDGPTMLSSAIRNADDLAVSVASHGSLLMETGPPARPGWASLSLPLSHSLGVTATISGPQSSGPVAQGMVLALLGALIFLLIFWFTYHLGTSRERAMQMVDARTADLRYQALHDPLTDLANRALLFDRAEQMLAGARRHPRSVGALYLDLDNFKDVNDRFGHDAGDELLKAVAARLAATVRQCDTVGRIGGDEFVILTEDDSSEMGPELIAERVMKAFEEPFVLSTPEEVGLNISASIGVTIGVRASATELVRDADVALYHAKEAGKGRYVTFEPGDAFGDPRPTLPEDRPAPDPS